MRFFLTTCIALLAGSTAWAQPGPVESFTKADTLRGSLHAYRTWWDVRRYDIEVEPDFATKSLRGRSTIKFTGQGPATMQLDLQQPMVADSILLYGVRLPFERQGNVILVSIPDLTPSAAEAHFISIYYHGTPREARRAPWDGGWVWATDEKGRPWMTVACQGLGASVWYPCKDHQSDEPDEGASLTIIAPADLMAVGNGRLVHTIDMGDKAAHRWEVRSPINTYNIVPYIGAYTSFEEVYAGEDGALSCSYWVLDYHLEKARRHFVQVPEMLRCFEHWLGPYPFYEDGYKLVEAPHLGMEHQSNIAYGNRYFNGYMGRDLSSSGWGTQWDFIIIHESGHEWFGNSITTRDIADMWVHEGFTNYTETLFTECKSGKAAAEAYLQGSRQNIRNDRPIIGPYGVNKQGSGDMYYKGASMLHTIRTLMGHDARFRDLLRGLSARFYHQTVTSAQVEQYIIDFCHTDTQLQGMLPALFDQYLRTTQVPVLSWQLHKGKLTLQLTNCLPQLALRVWVPTGTGAGAWHYLRAGQSLTLSSTLSAEATAQAWNRNLYIRYEEKGGAKGGFAG